MSEQAVHLSVDRPAHFSRLQLAVRAVAFCALGLLGVSFGAICLFLYLALPVVAATRLAARPREQFLAEDAPRIVRALRWWAALSAWVGLISDRLPAESPEENLHIEIHVSSRATPQSAMWRVLTGIPSALVLALLGCVGVLVWLWAALSILVAERVGPGAFRYLVGLQRWSLRLLAYQASIVDEYPSFSFADGPPPARGGERLAAAR